jgi:hypothetical protein
VHEEKNMTRTARRVYTSFVIASIGMWPISAAGVQEPQASGAGLQRSHWRASTFKGSAQHEASLAVDAGGGIVAAWSSRRQNGGRSGVFAQWFTPEGVAIGAETPISTTWAHHELAPAVAAHPDGGAWFAWQAHGRDGDGATIMARRFHPDRTAAAADFIVNQRTEAEQTSPHVAASGDGTVLVTWTSVSGAHMSKAGARSTSVRARWFAADGTPLTDDVDVDAGWAGSQTMPSGSFARDGSCAVAYAVTDETGRPRGVRVRRFVFEDNSWRAIQPAIIVCNDADRWQIEPVLAATSSGWMVAWLENDQHAAEYHAVAQRLSLDGTPGGDRMLLPGMQSSWQNGLAIAGSLDSDEVVIAWNESDSDDRGMAAQWVGGANPSSPIRINSVETGAQQLRQASSSPAMAIARDGSVAIAWSGDGGLDDSTAAHVSLLSPRPIELAGKAQGVTPEMPAAAQFHVATAASDAMTGAAMTGAASGDVAELGASPHEPPVFDPRQIAREQGRRESRELGGATGFTAILSTGWTPPDPHLSVGPDHIVVMTNGAIAFFDKTGDLQFQDQIEGGAGFWGTLGATNFVFDPETLFDPLSNRYFAMASEQAPGGQSFILIAVSDDDDPNGTWHKYRFNTTSLAGPTYDSPNIGVDADAVYISGDVTSLPGNVYPVFIFDKAAMLAGDPTSPVNSLTVTTSTESAGIPPVSFDDPPALYMVEHKESGNNTLVRLIALEDGLGTPVVSSLDITVPSYTPPEDPPQMGTATRPETFDARFWSVAYRNGSLWATHHVGSTRVLARWYEFAMNGWPASGRNPVLVQSGTIDPGPTIRTFFSAITVDDFGNAAMVFARSSPSEFISMATAYRAASDPPGTFQAPIIHQTSNAAYTINRWGDYSGINVDPIDGQTMWACHEYAISNTWQTWVQELIPPVVAPANDACADASAVSDGVTAFDTDQATTDGPDESATCSGGSPLQDVWFRYTATCSGEATVALCGSAFDAAIAVYGSTCPDAPGQFIACAVSSTECFDQQPFVTFDVVEGEQYLLRIGSESGATGAGDALITCNEPPCPADLTGDGDVGPADLANLLAAWQTDPGGPPDFDRSGSVGPEDLATLLAQWGPCT